MGCGTPEVRFVNNSSADVLYGIKFGDAIHDTFLSNGMTSPYYETDPGTYSVELKGSNGVYVEAFSGSWEVNRGLTTGYQYTVELEDFGFDLVVSVSSD